MSPSFFSLTVASLVVWRVTHLLQAEDGPWNVVVHLRRLAGNSVVGALLDCFYCLSLWLAAPLAYVVGANWKERLLLWPAISGAAILLERISDRSPPPIVDYREGDPDDVMLRQQKSPTPQSGVQTREDAND